MERHIVHLDLDTFFVSVERLKNSALIGKPVIVGGTGDRGVVASCSYEARQFGVHSAMSSKLAKQLCPDAIFVQGDHDDYSKYSKVVTDILTEKSPIVEKASIDEHYLDFTGMDKVFGCYKYAVELAQKVIKETGLGISFGLSENKTVSKIATGIGKPIGKMNISHGTEKHFLWPLPVRKIPMVGEKTAVLLSNMGITKIGYIQEMDAEVFYNVLGSKGLTIWNKANGIDNSPVVPYSEQVSMSKEETFLRDTIDMGLLRRQIVKMIDSLAFQLRDTTKLTSCVTIKIRYSNFDTYTQQCKIPYTASTKLLTQKALELFEKLYTKRMLIRLVGVKFSGLVHGGQQMSLFDDTIKDTKLNLAIDNIRNRFGATSIVKV